MGLNEEQDDGFCPLCSRRPVDAEGMCGVCFERHIHSAAGEELRRIGAALFEQLRDEFPEVYAECRGYFDTEDEYVMELDRLEAELAAWDAWQTEPPYEDEVSK